MSAHRVRMRRNGRGGVSGETDTGNPAKPRQRLTPAFVGRQLGLTVLALAFWVVVWVEWIIWHGTR